MSDTTDLVADALAAPAVISIERLPGAPLSPDYFVSRVAPGVVGKLEVRRAFRRLLGREPHADVVGAVLDAVRYGRRFGKGINLVPYYDDIEPDLRREARFQVSANISWEYGYARTMRRQAAADAIYYSRPRVRGDELDGRPSLARAIREADGVVRVASHGPHLLVRPSFGPRGGFRGWSIECAEHAAYAASTYSYPIPGMTGIFRSGLSAATAICRFHRRREFWVA